MSEIKLEQANHLIAAVLEEARNRNMPPICVAVLDSGAHLKALQREDGVSFLRAQISQAKAYGSIGLAVESRELADRYQQDDLQRGFINALNAMTGGKMIPLPGGILLRDDAGNIVGAVGVAGGVSDEDEACARNGALAAGFNC